MASKLSVHEPGTFFRGTDKEISQKLNFLLFGPLLGNKERCWDGPQKVKWSLCINGNNTFQKGAFLTNVEFWRMILAFFILSAKKSIDLFQCKRWQYFNYQTVESPKLNSICIGKNIPKPWKGTSLLLRRRPETEWMFAPNSPDDHKQPEPSTHSVLTNATLKSMKRIDIELLGKPSTPHFHCGKNLTHNEWKNILFLGQKKVAECPFCI